MFQDLGDCFADHTEIQTSTVLAGGWTVGLRKRVGGDSKGPSRHGATWKASFGGSVGRRNSHRQRGEWVGFRGMSRSPSAEGREEGPGAGTGSEARAGPEAAEATRAGGVGKGSELLRAWRPSPPSADPQTRCDASDDRGGHVVGGRRAAVPCAMFGEHQPHARPSALGGRG